ncbi:MAG: group III truncated hemoglobin [Betaproteobacteria bacterium]
MAATPEQAAAVEWMVRSFYERGLADEVLGPIFRGAIHGWEHHISIVADFWSDALYGTGRYERNAFAPHMKLDFAPEAFEHWLAAFEPAARDALPADVADQAMRIARHMVQSYRAGLFPFVGPDGRPSRAPAKR